MIGSEKTSKLHIHKGIVRANKREVNDYISMVNSLSFREGWCIIYRGDIDRKSLCGGDINASVGGTAVIGDPVGKA